VAGTLASPSTQPSADLRQPCRRAGHGRGLISVV
jgi:hypothetical protein